VHVYREVMATCPAGERLDGTVIAYLAVGKIVHLICAEVNVVLKKR
jgi:hypothetical protein